MQPIIGQQINENDPVNTDENYINIEGLRRVYKPKDQRESYQKNLTEKAGQGSALGRKTSTIECQTELKMDTIFKYE